VGSLLLIMGGAERRLPEQDVHYLWMDANRLRVSANPPSIEVCVGHFVCEFGPWSFYAGPSECPRELRINGRPVTERDVALPGDRAEVRLAGEPYSEPAPRQERPAPRSTKDYSRPAHGGGGAGPGTATRQRVIGPPGTDADLVIDDPSVRPDHARVEVDARGAWWVTAHNGKVYVDGEPVDWTVREPGTRFMVGRRTVTVPGRGGRRGGRALGVELAGVTVRRGGRALLDNVTLSVPAGDFVAVVGQNEASPQMLLGLVAGAHRPDSGTVRVGGSSRRGDPAVRCVPATDDLHGTLTVREVLGYAAALRSGAGEAARAAALVEEALSWLGLEAEADKWVRTLSEPQRKRLSVAAEVVQRPGLLLVPQSRTSHDIGRDSDLLSRLRTVSRDTNCTVVVATGSVGGLDGADLVVVLDAQGRTRFAGPPGQPLANQPDLTWGEWVATLDLSGGDPGGGVRPLPPSSPPACETVIQPDGAFAGMPAAVARQWLLFWRRGPGALAALPLLPVVGAILAALLLDGPAGPLAVAVLTGLSVGRADLVTERAALARDRRAGFGAGALVAAKLVVFGAVCAVLAVPAGVATAGALPRVPGPPSWASAWLLLWLVMVLSLCAGALATAATRTLFAAAAVGAAAVPALVALLWVLFSLGWVPALAGPVVLALGAGRLAAAVLEARLQP
jgi:ABC-type multidrug transport system ATPase subunit